MRRGDVVELLADQHLAPPLGDIPRGTLGEVLSTPPALWVFRFPRYPACQVLLEELRVVHGPRAWVYRALRYYRAQVRPRLPEASVTVVVAAVGPAVGAAIGGVSGAAIGGLVGLVAGGAAKLSWRLAKKRCERIEPTRRLRR